MKSKAQINAELINTCEMDDFDKLIVIKGWFNYFTDGQKQNLINILIQEQGNIKI